MTKHEKIITVTGFDPAGEPQISVQEDGSLHINFNFMPPSYMDNPDDLGVFSSFDADMQAFIGVPVVWDDREVFVIHQPAQDTIQKIIEFLQTYQPDIDHISGLWLGFYEYAAVTGKSRVAFSAVLKRNYRIVTGKSIEAQTFGSPTKDGLTAHFIGHFVHNKIANKSINQSTKEPSDNTIQVAKLYLVKTYDGGGGQHHSFAIDLRLDETGQSLTGTWSENKNWQGAICMKKVNPDNI